MGWEPARWTLLWPDSMPPPMTAISIKAPESVQGGSKMSGSFWIFFWWLAFAGTHTVLFINSEQGLKKQISVSVGAGETKPAIARLKSE